METKNAIIGAVAVVLIGGMFFVSNKPININVPVSPSPVTVNPAEINVGQPNLTVNSDGTYSEPTFGAVPTLDGVDNPYLSINGVRYYYQKDNMTATSSLPCVRKNPFNATSTIMSFSAQATSNGIAVTQNLYVSTSSTSYGSSTPSLVAAFPTGTGQWSILWTGSGTTTSQTIGGINADKGYSNVLVGPSEYLVLRVATSTPGTFSSYYTGACKALWREL